MADSEEITKAKEILRTKVADPQMVLDLVQKKLKQEKAFDYARKILAIASIQPQLLQDPKLPIALKVAQQQALCTYKDQNLSPDKRFDKALSILDEAHSRLGESLATTTDQETLGLAGAINKYRWEISGQKQHLEQSLDYYLRGYRVSVENDYGYTAINAAFVLDLLAFLESDGVEKSHPAYHAIQLRRDLARQIREEVLDKVLPLLDIKRDDGLEKKWWFLATLGEACFGLERYGEAEKWLAMAAGLPSVADWEKESTSHQLAALARIRFNIEVWKPDFELSPAGKALKAVVENNALKGILLGKVGLALSGGGFRASLFHIGVLARLAELDMLRHVEVLSCVSGGSIIGAHYYLELRKMLKATSDADGNRSHYIEIVRRIATDFLAGVQRNLRTRVAAEFMTNLKMIFKRGYTTTSRIGELYEEELFSKVQDGEGGKPRIIDEVFVCPAGEVDTFKPKLHNWRREAKVPMLILNATTLNTGHNWQFTASWMGEPPVNIDSEIDANYRLSRMYYDEAPPNHKRIRLGHAVAASSCVPGLFEPIAFPDLYPKKEQGAQNPQQLTVRLVDGGVHDNQGIASLLEQGCSVILVSDASGQMEAQNEPSKNLIGVPLRTNSILQARVRVAEYRELDIRRKSKALSGLMFVHLKKDLDSKPLDWITCQEPPDPTEELKEQGADPEETSYEIPKKTQKHLAAIRTDLDSFSDAEAYALMLSGYRMTEHEFPKTIAGYPSDLPNEEIWPFLAVRHAIENRNADGAEYAELNRLLEAGSGRAFKIWKLYAPLKYIGLILGLAALAAFVWASWRWSHVILLNLGTVGVTIIALLAGVIVGKTIIRVVKFRDTLVTIGLGISMSLVGWLVARIHLHVFDPFFKKYGTMKALAARAKKRK